MACVLLGALRRIGLRHTQFAEATCGTLRLALLRIGAQVRRSVRRIKLAMASAHPFQDEFALAHARLTAAGCQAGLTIQTPQADSAPTTPLAERRRRSMANLRRAPPSGRRSPQKAACNPTTSTSASRLVRRSG
jgi:Transposase DDE domain group 1